MPLKEKIERLNKDAAMIHEQVRGLNIRAAALSGVAAIIPHNAPAPAVYFKGYKVILHNVGYDHSAGGMRAAITFPHHGGSARFWGATHQFNINENWFE